MGPTDRCAHLSCDTGVALGAAAAAAAVIVLCQDDVDLLLQPLDGGAVLQGGNSIDFKNGPKMAKHSPKMAQK